MNNIKKLFLVLFVLSWSVQAAEIKHDFGSIQIGYADWDTGVEDADRGDLMKLVLDYGMILDKGELIVIYEHNHFEKNVDKRNYTVGGMGHYRLFDSDFTAFGKLWSKAENTVGDKLNMFYGIGYLGFANQKYFFKPYAALHHLSIDYISPVHGSANGHNGYIVGWMAGYNFNGQFSLTNWTDIQLDRNDAFTESFVAQGHDYGLSGGLSLKWKFTSHLSASFTYSYYLNEMAFDGWGDQLIYSVAYNF